MTDAIQGLSAVSIHVRDVPRARAFYRDALGLKEHAFDPRANSVVFEIPNSHVLLSMHIMAEGEGGREPGTVSGVIFRHEDPAAACAWIAAHGGTITVEPTNVQFGEAKFVRAAFADPDGNEFVVSSRKY